MERPRAADDFEVIRERLEELRREREEIASTNTTDSPNEDQGSPQQREECRGGRPAGSIPTIFLPQPTD